MKANFYEYGDVQVMFSISSVAAHGAWVFSSPLFIRHLSRSTQHEIILLIDGLHFNINEQNTVFGFN